MRKNGLLRLRSTQLVPGALGIGLERLAPGGAGVVDQHVQRALHLGGEADALVLAGQVGGHAAHLAVRRAARRRPPRRRRPCGCDDDGGAGVEQAAGDHQADAAAAAGDDGLLAGQVEQRGVVTGLQVLLAVGDEAGPASRWAWSLRETSEVPERPVTTLVRAALTCTRASRVQPGAGRSSRRGAATPMLPADADDHRRAGPGDGVARARRGTRSRKAGQVSR